MRIATTAANSPRVRDLARPGRDGGGGHPPPVSRARIGAPDIAGVGACAVACRCGISGRAREASRTRVADGTRITGRSHFTCQAGVTGQRGVAGRRGLWPRARHIRIGRDAGDGVPSSRPVLVRAVVPTALPNLPFILALAVGLSLFTAPARGARRAARTAFPGSRVTDGGVVRAGLPAAANRQSAAMAEVPVPAKLLIGVRLGPGFRQPGRSGERRGGAAGVTVSALLRLLAGLARTRLPRTGLPRTRLPGARPGVVTRRARQAQILQILLVLRPPAAHEPSHPRRWHEMCRK